MVEEKVKGTFQGNIITIRIREQKRPECYEFSSYIKFLLFLTLKQLFSIVAALNRLRNIVLNVHKVTPITR